MKVNGKPWKGMKLPNDKMGEIIDWNARIEVPSDWLISHKYDGYRVEIPETGKALSFELNECTSIHVKEMAEKFTESSRHEGVYEVEIAAPGMNLSEVAHFYKAHDVESAKSKAKYAKLWAKTGGDPNKGWKFPGRSVEWLTTWNQDLKFHIFDHVTDGENRTKEERYNDMKVLWLAGVYNNNTLLVSQMIPKDMEDVMRGYDYVIANGGEGLVAMKRKSLYKPGRVTHAMKQGWKIKETNVEFTGIIFEVPEGTIARPGAVKTISNHGRSKTSQKAEDRIPSGLASGLNVRLDNGIETTVSLDGFEHDDMKHMLENPELWIGKRITFSGMNSVKIGGKPRHAHYTNPKINV